MTEALWSFLSGAESSAPVARRGARALSAGALRAAALSLAEDLRDGEGAVYLYCEDAANFAAGLLGALISGRDILLPAHAAPAYLAEIGASSRNLVSDLSVFGGMRVSIADDDHASALPAIPNGRIGFFTSGTSGDPKLCMKALTQLSVEVAVLRSLWGAPKGAVVGTVSHQHIYGLLFRLLWPLASGTVFSSRIHESWESVADSIGEHGVVISSPAHLGRIPHAVRLQHKPDFIFSSGGPLSSEAAQGAQMQFGCWPTEVLGSTETGGVAWRQQREAGAAWVPLPRVEVSMDADGALMVKSPFTGSPSSMPMGDAVELLGDGRFRLKGRLDRIVKVEGKRVSLPRVEEALRALSQIDDAAVTDLPDRGGALGAVVVLSGKERQALAALGPFRYSRNLRTALRHRLEPMELPRFWRFVGEVPQNNQGKRIAAVMRALFASPELPQIEAERRDGDKVQFDLLLQPELRWFEGHFPGQPILPGVAQVHIVSVLAERIWGIEFPGHDMSRVKFRRVLQPGERVSLSLVCLERRIDFQYASGGEVVASGTVKGLV
ncbi:MAG: acyl-CoA synthetase [Parvibaculum sp.]|nr:acyl-CoA synthetase [Parvibaculum sp.]